MFEYRLQGSLVKSMSTLQWIALEKAYESCAVLALEQAPSVVVSSWATVVLVVASSLSDPDDEDEARVAEIVVDKKNNGKCCEPKHWFDYR